MPGPDEVALFAQRLSQVGADYMITGATAAILYGQPRVTNDLDVVIALKDAHLPRLSGAFPESEFYLPPEDVLRVEHARTLRGHFNILHLTSGFKADIYLAGADPLHAWALPRRRAVPWAGGVTLQVAPPEYVILRKLEYFREGRSDKHLTDIRAMLGGTTVDRAVVDDWSQRLGVADLWRPLAG